MRYGKFRNYFMSGDETLKKVAKFICPKCWCSQKIYILKISDDADNFICRACNYHIFHSWKNGGNYCARTRKKLDDGCFFLLELDEY